MIIFFLNEETSKQYNDILLKIADDLREEIFLVRSVERND